MDCLQESLATRVSFRLLAIREETEDWSWSHGCRGSRRQLSPIKGVMARANQSESDFQWIYSSRDAC